MPTDWNAAQRRLHWLIAGGIALALVLAAAMTAVPDQQRLLKFVLYQLHKTTGLLVLAAALARLILRLTRGRPPHPAGFGAWQRRLIAMGHGLLHMLGLVVPVLGYLANATSPSRIPVLFLMVLPLPNLTGPSEWWNHLLARAHLTVALLLLALAAGHAGMAVHHHRRGSAVLRRMWGAVPGATQKKR